MANDVAEREMTNVEFEAWRKKHFKTQVECASFFGFGREVIGRLESGVGRNGEDYPIPTHIELACAAYHCGVRSYNGGEVGILHGLSEDAVFQIGDRRVTIAPA